MLLNCHLCTEKKAFPRCEWVSFNFRVIELVWLYFRTINSITRWRSSMQLYYYKWHIMICKIIQIADISTDIVTKHKTTNLHILSQLAVLHISKKPIQCKGIFSMKLKKTCWRERTGSGQKWWISICQIIRSNKSYFQFEKIGLIKESQDSCVSPAILENIGDTVEDIEEKISDIEGQIICKEKSGKGYLQ